MVSVVYTGFGSIHTMGRIPCGISHEDYNEPSRSEQQFRAPVRFPTPSGAPFCDFALQRAGSQIYTTRMSASGFDPVGPALILVAFT